MRKSSHEFVLGFGGNGEKRDEVEHRLSFQGWRRTTACAQVERGAEGADCLLGDELREE